VSRIPLRILGGGHLDIDGPEHGHRWILFVCRDYFRRDDPLAALIARHFKSRGYTVARYEARITQTERLIDPPWIYRYRTPVRLTLKSLLLLAHPTRWKHFLPSHRRRQRGIPYRTAALRALVQHLGPDKEVHIIARSAGGRVASQIADEARVRSLVCLGYPFQHPTDGPDFDRTAHLPTLQTPFLILQGMQDPYGSLDAVHRYPLAPATQLQWVPTDHDFDLPDSAWPPLLAQIQAFLGNTQTTPTQTTPTRPTP
jgi:uncharacterized protein